MYSGGLSTRGSRVRFTGMVVGLTAIAAAVALMFGGGRARALTPLSAVSGPDVTPISSSHTISWDNYSLMVDGKRLMVWSGEFHYFRLPSPWDWTDILEKLKAAGFNAVSLYFDWSYHSPAQGVYDFSGVRNVNQLLNIANDLGIYVLVRPGPNIGAELDDGGQSDWVEQDAPVRSSSPCVVTGTTSCPSYGDEESQAEAWLHNVDQIIVNHQITNGTGSVIAYQLENEESNNLQYMADLAAQVRADGISVPLYTNMVQLSAGSYPPIGAGGTGGNRVFWNNMWAYNDYPNGLSCTNPYTWSQQSFWEGPWRGYDTSTPLFAAEFQGGAIDGWGGHSYVACNTQTNGQFERVFYLSNSANGVTLQNNYMTFGGTSWGWLPAGGSEYTSYDYGAAISEARVLTGKYFTLKELGFMFGNVAPLWATSLNTTSPANALNVTPAAATTCSNGVGGAALTNCGAIRIYNRVNASTPATGTNLYFVNHQEARGTLDSFFQLGPITTADGNYPAIPQYNAAGGTSNPAPSVELNGRDMKVLVADDNLDSSAVPQHLVYSTSNLMIDQTVNGQDIGLLFAPKGQSGETDLRYASRPTVTTLSGTAPTVTWTPDAGSATGSAGDLVLDYVHSGLTEVAITGGGATTPLLLALADQQTADAFSEQNIASSGAFLSPGGPLIERGPELVRTAAVNGSELDLTGDTNVAVTLTLWPPAGVTSVRWDGTLIPMTANTDGSLSSTSPLAGPPAIALPALNNWRYQSETPEVLSSFDDSQWTRANSDVTNSATKPPAGQPVLYATQYGFHRGDIWYRGHFTATTALTSVSVASAVGAQGVSEVWLNGTFLGSTTGAGGTTPVTYAVPAGVTNVGAGNVLAVLVHKLSDSSAGLISVTTTPPNDGLNAYQPQTTLAGGSIPAGTTNLDVLSTSGFAVGQQVTVGSGANAETSTITQVGAAAAAPTSLAAPVPVGVTTISVASASGFAAGQQIAVDTGGSGETATVASVGTAATAATQLYAAAPAGATTVHVSSTSGFAVGQPIEIGTGANYSAGGAEQATVTSVGTQARDLYLAAPAAAGTSTIKVPSVTGLSAGDTIVLDYQSSNGCSGCTPAGANNQETATIASVGTPATTTTLAAAGAIGATNIKVASVAGLSAGDQLVIDSIENVTIASVGTAGSAGTGVTLTSALQFSHSNAASLVDVSQEGSGLTLTGPLQYNHSAFASLIDYGTGVSFTPALTLNHPLSSAVQALGSGVTLTAALGNSHAWGASVFPSVVASPATTGITVSPALGLAHPAGAPVTGPTPPAYWMVQGDEGGENITDTVRGADNNGGSYGENAGWSLAGYPDSSGNWTAVTLPFNDPTPGIAWYRDTFNLNLPAGTDVPLSVDISDVPTKAYRAQIFVNGWNMGQYINNVGPQQQFVVQPGIYNPNGSNTIAIQVITANAGGGPTGGGLGSVELVGAPNTASQDDTSPAITYGTSSGGSACSAGTGGWAQLNSANSSAVAADFDQTESLSANTNDCFSIAFSGTAIRWIAALAPNNGIAAVYLDGVLQGNVDGYGPSTRGQHTMWSAYGLANTTHTLTVVNTGTHNPLDTASPGTYLDLDAIDLPPSGVVEGGAGAVAGGPTALLVNSPAYVAPTLTGQALTAAPGGAGVSGTVATVTVPPDALGTAFAATIDWGDGSHSAGTVSGSGSSYAIAGSHTYSTGGAHNVTVTLTDQYDGSVLATATTTTTTDVTTVTTSPGGNVPSTLSISVGATAPTFGAFTPGVAQTYTASQAATITSTAASAILTAGDTSPTCPGYLANSTAVGGPYCLSQGLQMNATDASGTSTGGGTYSNLATTNPATLLTFTAPVSNDPVTIGFMQAITATTPLRTGTYSKTITLSLTTNTP